MWHFYGELRIGGDLFGVRRRCRIMALSFSLFSDLIEISRCGLLQRLCETKMRNVDTVWMRRVSMIQKQGGLVRTPAACR